MTGCSRLLSLTHPTYATKSYPPGAVIQKEPAVTPAPRQSPDTADPAMVEKGTQTDTVTEPTDHSPTKRVCVTGAIPSTSRGRKPAMRNKCRVCFEDWVVDGQLWVGCSHLSKRGLQTCPMWVHQKCIWLKYSTAADLGKVRVFCPEHHNDA